MTQSKTCSLSIRTGCPDRPDSTAIGVDGVFTVETNLIARPIESRGYRNYTIAK